MQQYTGHIIQLRWHSCERTRSLNVDTNCLESEMWVQLRGVVSLAVQQIWPVRSTANFLCAQDDIKQSFPRYFCSAVGIYYLCGA